MGNNVRGNRFGRKEVYFAIVLFPGIGRQPGFRPAALPQKLLGGPSSFRRHLGKKTTGGVSFSYQDAIGSNSQLKRVGRFPERSQNRNLHPKARQIFRPQGSAFKPRVVARKPGDMLHGLFEGWKRRKGSDAAAKRLA